MGRDFGEINKIYSAHERLIYLFLILSFALSPFPQSQITLHSSLTPVVVVCGLR